jgi:hypothetical protein
MKYFILLVLFSCTSLKHTTEQHMVAGKCEKEFQKIELSPGENIWQNVVESTTTTASYLVTGLGYSTDVIVTYGGGTIVTLAVCSPVLLLEGAAYGQGSSNMQISAECVGNVGSKVYKGLDTNLGKQAHKDTEKWRCPDIDHIAEGLLRVSSCYRKNGDDASAEKQLATIRESKLFKKCLSKSMLKKISKSQ